MSDSVERILRKLEAIERRLDRLEEVSHEQPDMDEMLRTAMRFLREVDTKSIVKRPSSRPRVRKTPAGVISRPKC